MHFFFHIKNSFSILWNSNSLIQLSNEIISKQILDLCIGRARSCGPIDDWIKLNTHVQSVIFDDKQNGFIVKTKNLKSGQVQRHTSYLKDILFCISSRLLRSSLTGLWLLRAISVTHTCQISRGWKHSQATGFTLKTLGVLASSGE